MEGNRRPAADQGKHTAGVDGVKTVPPARRSNLVIMLGQPDAIKPRPTGRVWIPKPGSTTE
jgi:RNA-directed DNA polymerase